MDYMNKKPPKTLIIVVFSVLAFLGLMITLISKIDLIKPEDGFFETKQTTQEEHDNILKSFRIKFASKDYKQNTRIYNYAVSDKGLVAISLHGKRIDIYDDKYKYQTSIEYYEADDDGGNYVFWIGEDLGIYLMGLDAYMLVNIENEEIIETVNTLDNYRGYFKKECKVNDIEYRMYSDNILFKFFETFTKISAYDVNEGTTTIVYDAEKNVTKKFLLWLSCFIMLGIIAFSYQYLIRKKSKRENEAIEEYKIRAEKDRLETLRKLEAIKKKKLENQKEGK